MSTATDQTGTNAPCAKIGLGDLILAPHYTALSVEDFEAARKLFVSVFELEAAGRIRGREPKCA